jgi:hypothetical protein
MGYLEIGEKRKLGRKAQKGAASRKKEGRAKFISESYSTEFCHWNITEDLCTVANGRPSPFNRRHWVITYCEDHPQDEEVT